eukprot:11816510-Prorocentrum_lima.AAC.1
MAELLAGVDAEQARTLARLAESDTRNGRATLQPTPPATQYSRLPGIPPLQPSADRTLMHWGEIPPNWHVATVL